MYCYGNTLINCCCCCCCCCITRVQHPSTANYTFCFGTFLSGNFRSHIKYVHKKYLCLSWKLSFTGILLFIQVGFNTGDPGSWRDYAKRDSRLATTLRCCVTTFWIYKRLYGRKTDSKFSVHSDILVTKLIYLDTLLFFLLLSRFSSRSEAI